MNPRFILKERMSVYFMGDLVIVHIIIYCLLYDSSFLYSCNMIIPFFIDYLRFNQIYKMLLGDHLYL